MTEGINATPPLVRAVAGIVIQTGGMGLPASDSGWSTQRYLRFDGGSEGCSTLVGEARLVQDFGVLEPQGGSIFQSVGIAPDIARTGTPAPLIGLVVRLLKQDGGSVQIDGKGYTPFWWGRIIASDLVADRAATKDTGGRMTWSAVGLASAFDQIALSRGVVLSSSGTTLVGIGYLPEFNRVPGGDRSTSTKTLNGQSVYVHDIANPTTGNLWTAKQALQHVLALGTLPVLDQLTFDPTATAIAQGWSLQLDAGVGTLLDYVLPPTDLNGLTLLQAISAIVSVKRGLVWKLSVSGATITLKVYSAAGSPISAGGFNLPASTYTASVVAAGSVWLADVRIVQDNASLYDIVEVRGGYPWLSATLAYLTNGIATGVGQLGGQGYGWSAAAETSWGTDPTKTLVEHVWRLFQVDPAWNGNGYITAGGFATAIAFADYDARLFTAMAPARIIAAERMLPCSPGFSTLKVGPRQAPVICISPDGASWIDKSREYRVEAQSDPLAVHVDDGQLGQSLKQWTAAGGAFLVSIGVRGFMPLRAVWSAASLGRGGTPTPRTKVIHLPSCELWVAPAGTVTGVDPTTGALTALAADVVVRDDTTTIQQALTLASAWYGQPTYRVTWRDRGNHDIGDAYAPARLVTSVQLGDASYGMYALITRRSWVVVERDGVPTIDTIYETDRVLPDLEAVL